MGLRGAAFIFLCSSWTRIIAPDLQLAVDDNEDRYCDWFYAEAIIYGSTEHSNIQYETQRVRELQGSSYSQTVSNINKSF